MVADERECESIVKSVWTLVRRQAKESVKDPAMLFHLEGHALWEERAVMREIFYNMMNNMIKHVLDDNPQKKWGLKLEWKKGGNSEFPGQLANSIERWRTELQPEHGVCMFKLWPFEMEYQKFRELAEKRLMGEETRGLGFWILATYTSAYCSHRDEAEDPIPPVDLDEDEKALVIILPGR